VNPPELDELRLEAAAARGLSPAATSFLDGSTVEEIEQAADALARLAGVHGGGRKREQQASSQATSDTADPLAAALAEGPPGRARRQATLVAALHGRPSRPRDQQGRFVGGFDGGARSPAPSPASPEKEHGEFLGSLIAASRTYARGF
jgi:hypothetical protein